MVDRALRSVIAWSVGHRFVALLLGLVVLGAGFWSARRLPLDVTPDISNVQVQVLTAVPSLSPEEAEKSITRPIELEMFGLPGLQQVRSLTRFGVSQVSLVFSDKTDVYRARQLVTERLTRLADALPRGLVPKLAPLSTGLGEVYTYALAFKKGAGPSDEEARLRALKLAQEFVVKPALRGVPGVADVNSTGGYDQALVVAVDPRKLNPLGIDLNDVANQVEKNVAIGGGALIDGPEHQVIARSLARAQTPQEIAATCVKLNWGAEIVPLAQVASVKIGSGIRLGAATLDGEEAVLGTVLMLPGENPRTVTRALRERLPSVQQSLGRDIAIVPLYDRSNLNEQVVHTVTKNLLFAAVLVLAVLLLLLGDWRAALIVTATLLLSFSLGLTGMTWLGVAGSLLSLGAIDFGVVVDDTVVLVENVVRRLRSQPTVARDARHALVVDACTQVRKPMFIGMLVIIGMYLPVLALSGVEGKLFQPMAVTLILILLGSLLMTLTVVPALCAISLTGTNSEPLVLRWLQTRYQQLFRQTLRARSWLLISAGALLVAAAAWGSKFGADFMPYLDEGWLVVEVQRDPQISLPESVRQEKAIEQAILAEVPEVTRLFARMGMSSIATDPQGANQNDIYLELKPQNQWRQRDGRRLTKLELGDLIKEVIDRKFPGQDLALNQPISVRFDEMLEGIRTDVAVKVYGDNFDVLDGLAEKISTIARSVRGTGEVAVERTGRADTLEFQTDRMALLRYMANADQINVAISTALHGREVGRIDDGETFYPVVVRISDADRNDPEARNVIPFRAADGSLVLGLGNVGRWNKVSRVQAISREAARRREAVMISVNTADVTGYVAALRAALAAKVKLPPGYAVEFAGEYQNLQSGLQRLGLATVAVLVVATGLIFFALGSWRQTALVLAGVPFAAIGGICGLGLRGLPFTMPAAVGFVTLAGLAILNGLVLVTYFNQLRSLKVAVQEAARQSALARLRPVLITALVAVAGFLPMAFSTAVGAEIQRPLATVVIGGVVSAALMTLLILPTLLVRLYSNTPDESAPILSADLDGAPADT